MVFGQLVDRLAHADAASNPIQHTDDPETIARRELVATTVSSVKALGKIPSSSIFTNLRFADSLGQGKTNIDIIIVSGWRLDCFMVENWSGTISHDQESDNFTVSSSGSLKQIPNPIAEANRRSNLVRTYLLQAGIAIKAKNCIGRLALLNADLQDSTEHNSVFNNASVIRDLDQFCKAYINTWFWTFADPTLPALVSGAISYSQLAKIHMALAKLGTFDVAFLTGGRHLVGDFLGSNTLIITRKDVEEIEVEKQSIGIGGKVKTAFGFFPEVSCILWRRGGKGWWFRDKHSTILIPYNQTIAFKISGEQQDAHIPINEIVRIIVSK